MIIKFVPNCFWHVSGDVFSGGSDTYLQFWDTCGKRRSINLILDVTPQKDITWGCIWKMRWQVVKTPTIISNNTTFIHYIYVHPDSKTNHVVVCRIGKCSDQFHRDCRIRNFMRMNLCL